tara:strand:- start:306 stop:497 length:192 start_codon:yes stop_codon:yes gene_type:complete
MSNLSKYYGKGKLVVLKFEDNGAIGAIQYANHRSDKYQIMWKRPGGERWIGLHSRLALKPYLG